MLEQLEQYRTFLKPYITEPFQLSGRYDATDIRWGDIISNTTLHSTEFVYRIALVGVPQDAGVRRNNGRSGAAEAPSAIRERFYKLTPGIDDESVFRSTVQVMDIGDIYFAENDTLEEMHQKQYKVISALLQAGIIPIVLGGGHDIAYPNGKAVAEVSSSISIVNIDAHCDVRPLTPDGRAHSGTPFGQLLREEHQKISPNGFVEYGIHRFSAATAHREFVEKQGGAVYFYDDIIKNSVYSHFEGVLQNCCKTSPETAVYVSFDIDAVNMAYAPGVSAPAVYGFSAMEACQMSLLSGLCTQTKLFDIVEVNPVMDIDSHTARLAAYCIASFIRGVTLRQ